MYKPLIVCAVVSGLFLYSATLHAVQAPSSLTLSIKQNAESISQPPASPRERIPFMDENDEFDFNGDFNDDYGYYPYESYYPEYNFSYHPYEDYDYPYYDGNSGWGGWGWWGHRHWGHGWDRHGWDHRWNHGWHGRGVHGWHGHHGHGHGGHGHGGHGGHGGHHR